MKDYKKNCANIPQKRDDNPSLKCSASHNYERNDNYKEQIVILEEKI